MAFYDGQGTYREEGEGFWDEDGQFHEGSEGRCDNCGRFVQSDTAAETPDN